MEIPTLSDWARTALAERPPTEFRCTACSATLPIWFKADDRRRCKACEALRRRPEIARGSLDRFRQRALDAAETRRMRTAGMNRCLSCGIEHAIAPEATRRWRHICRPCARLTIRLHRQVAKAKKRDGIGKLMRDALARAGSSPKVSRLLGYSIVDLRSHLERQFLPGMTWANMDAWHIDHIVPQASFNLSSEGEWRACWSLSNLRPMWGAENIAKSSRRLFLL